MNKTELIDEIAVKTGLTKADTHKFLEAFVSTVSDALKNNEDVNLVGFGSFSTTLRPSRVGRNPKTGEPINIAESKVPKFKPGKILKDSLNKG